MEQRQVMQRRRRHHDGREKEGGGKRGRDGEGFLRYSAGDVDVERAMGRIARNKRTAVDVDSRTLEREPQESHKKKIALDWLSKSTATLTFVHIKKDNCSRHVSRMHVCRALTMLYGQRPGTIRPVAYLLHCVGTTIVEMSNSRRNINPPNPPPSENSQMSHKPQPQHNTRGRDLVTFF